MKAGIKCCKLPLKAQEKDKEKIQEATTRLANVKWNSVDAAVVAVLLELDGLIFT